MPFEDSYWTKARGRNTLSRRRMLRRTAAVGVGLAGIGVLGCAKKSMAPPTASSAASSSAGGPPVLGGTLNIFTQAGGDATTLDPYSTQSGTTAQIAEAVMSRLLRFKTGPDPKVGENHDLESDLALSFESPDALTWTVKLHPDAKFQDFPPVNGHAVEATDIKATFARVVTDPKNTYRSQFDMIDPAQIQTPDTATVVFKLKYPYAPFEKIMATPQSTMIFPREAITQYDPTKQLIGSGPFSLESHAPDVAFNFKKNPNWFQKGQPYVDGVKAAIAPDESQRLAQFTAANVDIFQPQQSNVDTTKQNYPKATALQTFYGSNPEIFWNVSDPASPFRDVRVRRAVSMALDRDALAKVASFGSDYQGSLQITRSLGKWALTPEQLDANVGQYYKYNLDMAKQLLAAAGATNISVKFEYGQTGGPPAQWASAIVNMLNQLPWKVTGVPVADASALQGGGKGPLFGNYSPDTMVFYLVQTFVEADQFLHGRFYSTSPSNRNFVKDSNLDSMLDKARRLTNDDERLKADIDIQKLLADQIYNLTGFPGIRTTVFLQPWVNNYSPAPHYAEDFPETHTKLWMKR